MMDKVLFDDLSWLYSTQFEEVFFCVLMFSIRQLRFVSDVPGVPNTEITGMRCRAELDAFDIRIRFQPLVFAQAFTYGCRQSAHKSLAIQNIPYAPSPDPNSR
jgi:hypothetical protein